ncbi:MAG: hypothetical protein JW751_20340 [Polyangiaceae bacterium]|nr:hypothetical protein [Polyangiaceae bacterium]
MACARAGAERAELTRVAEGALTGVDGRPPLLSDLAAFLRGLAAGEIGSRPAGLSPALAGSLGELLKALTEPG